MSYESNEEDKSYRSKSRQMNKIELRHELYVFLGAFCEVKMGPQKFNTNAIENSLNPKWNTSMQFQVYDLQKDQLTFTIYDQKIYSPNILLGRARVNISSIYQEQIKENNPIIKVFRLSDGRSGKVMIKMNISIYQ